MAAQGAMGERVERDITELEPKVLISTHNLLLKKYKEEKDNFEFIASELTLNEIKAILKEINRRKSLLRNDNQRIVSKMVERNLNTKTVGGQIAQGG